MRGHRAIRLAGVLAAAALALAACGQDGAGTRVSTPTGSTTPTGSSLGSVPAGAEGLDPCPRTTPQPGVTNGLPDIILECLGNGPAVQLAALRGEPMLVNVWASWCPPCRAEMPWLQAAYDDGLAVLGVDAEDLPSAAGSLVEALGVTYPSVFDPLNQVGVGLGIPSKPVTLMLAADGTVVYTQVGAFASAAQLRSLVAEHLGVTLP